MKTILAPVDFSAVTDRVCATAAELARALNGRVVLLHSVPQPVVISEYGVMVDDLTAMDRAAQAAAAKQLSRLRKKLGAVPSESLLFTGTPVPHIVAEAARLEADYLVIGSHGHTTFYDLLVGSTTHGVLMKAVCPVVVVHAAPGRQPAPAIPAPRKRKA